MHADVEGIVELFIHQLVILHWRSQRMTPDLIRQQRLLIFLHVIQRTVVAGPGQAGGDIFQHVFVPVAGFQITEADAVLTT